MERACYLEHQNRRYAYIEACCNLDIWDEAGRRHQGVTDAEEGSRGLEVSANPITHLVTVVRDLMHGTVPVGQIGQVLLVSAALTAVFAPLTMYLYRNKR